MHSHPPQYPLFPYTTLFRSRVVLFKKVTLLEDHALRNDLTPDGPIGVVGASAAGLFSALLFARAGRQVRVFERAERLDPAVRTLIVTERIRNILGPSLEKCAVNEIRGIELFTDGRAAAIQLDVPDLVIERSRLS